MPSSSLPNPPTFPLALDLDHNINTDYHSDSDSTTASAIDPDDIPRVRRADGGKAQNLSNDDQKSGEGADGEGREGASDTATVVPNTSTNTDAAGTETRPTDPNAPFPCLLLLTLSDSDPQSPSIEVLLIDPRTATIPSLLAAAKDVFLTSPNISPTARAKILRGDLKPWSLSVDMHSGLAWGRARVEAVGGVGGEGGKGDVSGEGGKRGGRGGKVKMVGGKVNGKGGKRVKVHKGNLRACLMLLGRGGGGLVVEFRGGAVGT